MGNRNRTEIFQQLWRLSSQLSEQLAKEWSAQLSRRFRETTLPALKDELNVLRGAHRAAHLALRARGYEWELRRNGDLKIGLWRKKFRRRATSRSAQPKRLVLVPGFGDSPLSWLLVIAPLLPVLRSRFDELVLLDFPGYTGFLSREKGFPSMDLLMTSLFDVLDGLRPTTILGHSLGGCLTAHYAGLCGKGDRPVGNRKAYAGPETIVLANPSGMFESSEARNDLERKLHELVEVGFDSWKTYIFHRQPFWFGWMRKEFERFIGAEEVVSFLYSLRDEHALNDALPHITAKTWLLWGERDSLIPITNLAAWLEKLNPANENVRAVVLSESSHTLQVETPGATVAVLGQILSGRIPHAAGRRWWRVVERAPLNSAG